MKTLIQACTLAAGTLALTLGMAGAPALAAGTSAAPAAGVTALCKDGTSYSGASKRGACSGHKGVKEWYGVQGASQPAPQAAAPAARNTTPAPAPTTRRTAPANAAAAGGGAGKVWVNTDSKVYHCQGDRWYGNTKAGQYMSESQARSMGARPDHGKACS
jgi:hypothetical protein